MHNAINPFHELFKYCMLTYSTSITSTTPTMTEEYDTTIFASFASDTFVVFCRKNVTSWKYIRHRKQAAFISIVLFSFGYDVFSGELNLEEVFTAAISFMMEYSSEVKPGRAKN